MNNSVTSSTIYRNPLLGVGLPKFAAFSAILNKRPPVNLVQIVGPASWKACYTILTETQCPIWVTATLSTYLLQQPSVLRPNMHSAY